MKSRLGNCVNSHVPVLAMPKHKNSQPTGKGIDLRCGYGDWWILLEVVEVGIRDGFGDRHGVQGVPGIRLLVSW